MTLEQKIGQMTQPDIRSVTPDEVRQYYLGSVLNGGGAWPGMNKHATVGDWLALSDQFYRASMSTDMPIKVPVVWGTDAVHGHNNIYGATLFPHNIGLGAANDPAMMERIGQATARQVRATGITWAFAPTSMTVWSNVTPAAAEVCSPTIRTMTGSVTTAFAATDTTSACSAPLNASALGRSNGVSTFPMGASARGRRDTVAPAGASKS